MANFIMKNGSFWISKAPAPASVAITAATKGATTQLTVTNTASVDDAVIVTGSGWSSLDGKVGVITVASGTAITIALDSSAETTTFPASGATVAIYESDDFVESCLQGVNLDSGTADTIAVGTFCDPGAQLAGAIPNGTLALSGFVDPTSDGYNELTSASADGLPRICKLVLPKAANPAATGNNGGIFYFPSCTVGAISQSYQTNAAATFTSTVIIGGKATFAPAT